MEDLRESIRQKAFDLGFDKVGFAAAVPLTDEKQRLAEWLGRGFQAEMRWMERDTEKRGDPCRLFPGAKTIVALAMNYYTPAQHSGDPSRGKISRYAWGSDYHDVVKKKLYTLLDRIVSDCPDARGKVCVDTAPIMEKSWAARAGVGWIGKHSNIITASQGSWVFLGEILLDIEIEPDAPAEDHCGTCTACLDACPTQAITEPYVVDSNKCISYATIELRSGELPNEITTNLNGWLYGCDICQDVCPWNRFEQPTDEAAFQPRDGEADLSIEHIAAMTHEEYVERFRGSAMKRAKLKGLKRNAAALGNQPEPKR